MPTGGKGRLPSESSGRRAMGYALGPTMRSRAMIVLLACGLAGLPGVAAGRCASAARHEGHAHEHVERAREQRHDSDTAAREHAHHDHGHARTAATDGAAAGGTAGDGSGDDCCRSGSTTATVGAYAVSNPSPKLFAGAVVRVQPVLDLAPVLAVRGLRSLFRDELRSPYVRTRAPLLI